MIYVKKYWWIVLVILLTGASVWWLKPNKVIQQPNQDQVLIHKFDSLKYIHKNDSLTLVIDTLKAKLDKKKRDYADLLNRQKKEREKLPTLTASEVVEEFQGWVEVPVTMVAQPDTMIITPLQGIRNAVEVFVEKDQCLAREDEVIDQVKLANETIVAQDTLLKVKNNRIIGLTREYFQSQAAVNKLNNDLKKSEKKLRTKNVILGILSGVAAVGIVIAVVK